MQIIALSNFFDLSIIDLENMNGNAWFCPPGGDVGPGGGGVGWGGVGGGLPYIFFCLNIPCFQIDSIQCM